MLHNLTGWHAIIILAIILLLFGAAKLPALARSLGQSMSILKTEAENGSRAQQETAETTTPAAPGSQAQESR